MDETTERLYSTTDAQVWAKEWCRIAREIEAGGSGLVIDEGWMIGWFANAMQTAADDASATWRGRAEQLAEALRLTQEYVGSETLPPKPGWSWWVALSEFYGEPFTPADQRPPTPPDPNEVPVAQG